MDLSRTVGWFTANYPVALAVAGLGWAQVVAGGAALGAVIKDAKEQLRALPDGVTYGLLRYLNPDVELAGSDPPIGFNYLGRLGAAAREAVRRCVADQPEGRPLTGAAAALPMPLMHTVELNAVTVDTDTGPQLHADWTWAPSALDHAQIGRLSRLWFDALTGICAHVRSGGGGLTPSDIAPARLNQPQIDELRPAYPVADILPLTPLQQGLLFHASTAQAPARCVCGAAGYHLDRPAGPASAARCGAAGGRPVIRNLVARFCAQFDEPVQIIPADPVVPWRYVDLDRPRRCRGADPAAVRRRTRRGLRSARTSRPSGSALVRTAADRHRLVLTNHHIVLDGWSMPILLQRNLRQLSRAAAARAGAVSQICHLAGRAGPASRPRSLA